MNVPVTDKNDARRDLNQRHDRLNRSNNYYLGASLGVGAVLLLIWGALFLVPAARLPADTELTPADCAMSVPQLPSPHPAAAPRLRPGG